METTKALKDFEGLIFKTAVLYERRLRTEREDLQQVLRIRVWLALEAFEPSRTTTNVESFVFTCLRNQIKDLVKARMRRDNIAREFYLEDIESIESYPTYDDPFLDDDLLPTTITESERVVIGLMYVGYQRPSDMAPVLGVTPKEVSRRVASIRLKLADLRPSGQIGELPLPLQRELGVAA